MAGSAVEAVIGWLLTIVNALAGLAAGIIEFLPVADDLGLEVPDGWIVGYTWLNTVLPVTEALGLMGAMIALNTGAILYRVAVVAWHLLPKPGIGT